jgi:CBS-domain-containing membrane protein
MEENKMATPYSIQDERSRYGYDPGYERDWERGYHGGRDRDIFERAGDEVRSWFGNEEAERRRRGDAHETERRQRQGGYWNRPGSATDMRAGHLMTRNVATVSPQDYVERAARLMRDCDCGALPVVNNYGRLMGMITDRDIAMRLVARGADTRRALVSDCMTDETFCAHINDRLEDCLRQMARHQVRRLPIVNDDNQIVGIISQGDLARHAEAYQGRGERRWFAETVSEISEPSSGPYR